MNSTTGKSINYTHNYGGFNFVQQGWQCPKCKRILAPFMSHCPFHDEEYNEEVVSMQYCKWLIEGICCNDKSDCLADYPFPMSICEMDKDGKNYACGCFEKEDGVIND